MAITFKIGMDPLDAEQGLKRIIDGSEKYKNSLAGLQKKLSDLAAITASLDLGSKSFITVDQQVKATEASILKANQTIASVTASSKQFAYQTGTMNSTLIGLNYTLRDLPFGFMGIQNNLPMLFDGFQKLKAETGSLGGALKTIFSSSGIFGTMGIGLAFSAITSLITYFSMQKKSINDNTKAMEELNKEFAKYKKMVDDISDPSIIQAKASVKWMDLKQTRQTISDLGRLKEVIISGNEITSYSYEKLAIAFQKAYGKSPQENLDAWRKLMKDPQALVTVNNLISSQEQLARTQQKELTVLKENTLLNATIYDKHKKTTKELDKQTDILKKQMSMFEMATGEKHLWRVGRGLYGKTDIKDKENKAETFNPTEEEMLYANLFKDAANVMRSEFSTAWEKVFGEANSLFEKLLMSWAESIATYLGNQLAGSLVGMLLDFIPIGEILGLGGKTPSANRTGSTNYLVVDGAVIGKFVDDYLPTATANNKRLRRM